MQGMSPTMPDRRSIYNADQPPYMLWRYADAQMYKHAFGHMVGLIGETVYDTMWQRLERPNVCILSPEENDLLDLCDFFVGETQSP